MNAVGSFIAVFFIDKLGRRFIILRTLPGVLISCVTIALSMYLSLYTENMQTIGNFLALLGLLMYLGFFSIGFSSTPWSINTEIYPTHLIGTATSLSTATNWLSNFVVSSVFLSIMKTDLGKVLAFVTLAIFTTICIIFVYIFVPETKGKSI